VHSRTRTTQHFYTRTTGTALCHSVCTYNKYSETYCTPRGEPCGKTRTTLAVAVRGARTCDCIVITAGAPCAPAYSSDGRSALHHARRDRAARATSAPCNLPSARDAARRASPQRLSPLGASRSPPRISCHVANRNMPVRWGAPPRTCWRSANGRPIAKSASVRACMATLTSSLTLPRHHSATSSLCHVITLRGARAAPAPRADRPRPRLARSSSSRHRGQQASNNVSRSSKISYSWGLSVFAGVGTKGQQLN